MSYIRLINIFQLNYSWWFEAIVSGWQVDTPAVLMRMHQMLTSVRQLHVLSWNFHCGSFRPINLISATKYMLYHVLHLQAGVTTDKLHLALHKWAAFKIRNLLNCTML